MKRLALITAILALGAAAPAQATLMPADEVVDARVLEVARAQWPDSWCNGRERISVQLRVYHNQQDYAGWAYRRFGCDVEVRLDWMMNTYSACLLLSHEFGHLAGNWFESDIPGDIMNGPGLSDNRTFKPCLDLAHSEE